MTSRLHKTFFCMVAATFVSLMASSSVLATESGVSLSGPLAVDRPLIAVLVPPKGGIYDATKSLRDGILASYATNSAKYELREYEMLEGETPFKTIDRAVADGAMVAIGPITRKGVSEVASVPFLPLPLVALNRLEEGTVAPELFASIDLAAETEVEQVVRIALANTSRVVDSASRSFVIFTTQDRYDQRIARAFEKEIARANQKFETRMVTQEQMRSLKEEIRDQKYKGAFFAMGVSNASLIRPYCPLDIPIFGTSYTTPSDLGTDIAANAQARDLMGLIAVDIPAVLELNKAVYRKYRDQIYHLPAGDKRLFALGVDAFRVATLWLEWRQIFAFDGLTGKVSFDRNVNERVNRELTRMVVRPRASTGTDDRVQFEESASEAGY